MLSTADKVDGQGVGSAYLEQVNLIKECASDIFDVRINSHKKSDIIHHHTIDFNNYLMMKTSSAINVAYVHFLPHTLDGSIKLPKPIFNIFKKYVIEFYNSADYLVVVNPTFIDDLVKYKIPREKIKYIPNYVSKDQFLHQSHEQTLVTRAKYNIAPDAFVVLGCGQVQTRKGVLDFIKCAQKLPQMTFVWCGGFSFGKITDGYEELKKIYDNPPKNVKFLGIIPRSEMNDMFNMANVLFMPSYNELFPMAILEAVNSYTPVLLRDLDLYKDILFNKYLTGTSINTFTQQLKSLQVDRELYKQAQENSKYISNYYSKENVMAIWKEFYLHIYEKKQIKGDS